MKVILELHHNSKILKKKRQNYNAKQSKLFAFVQMSLKETSTS